MYAEEEWRLATFYSSLFDKVDFVQFYRAYLEGSIDKLAQRVGLGEEVSFWKNQRGAVLGIQPGTGNPSVYNLKEFLLSEDTVPINSVKADYGYFNCKSPHERELWRDIYYRVFHAKDFDMAKMHEACIQGKIYEYVKQLFPGTPIEFKRLAVNIYPL
jgi:hypothetical protein